MNGVFALTLSCGFSALFGHKTIIISSDGFRWDYYGRFETPGLDRLRGHGVHVKNLENAFATVTFPNHFSLVTGLYEESHGIVDNEMFDPLFEETFNMSTTDPKWWQEGEPIWVTANKSGVGSVCVNWVGCSVPIQNIRPTKWNEYDGSIPFPDRIKRVVGSLYNSDDSIDLGLVYFEEPDHSCHMHGPDSQEVRDAISKVDAAVSFLLDSVNLDEINVIFTSDHGGFQVSREKLITLSDYLDGVDYFVSADGAVAHIWFSNETLTDPILQLLADIPSEKGRCDKKQDVPTNLHYSNNRRIAPIVCVAELGWSFVSSQEAADAFLLKGSHGWDSHKDPESPMRPIFIGAGPGIVKSDRMFEPFPSVDVYPLVHKLIGLSSDRLPDINGTIDRVKHLIYDSVSQESEAFVVLQW